MASTLLLRHGQDQASDDNENNHQSHHHHHFIEPLQLDESSYQHAYPKQHPNHRDRTRSLHLHASKYHDLFRTLAGVAGNVLEWYDFAVFGYFSDVLGVVFFPPDQPGHAALMESFAVFGGAFVMRPLGGILMGHIGDTYSRKFALELSIFLMAVPTFCMGLLPSYNQVGALSYILLILIRLVQGLSVGGQLMSSLVFTLESKPKQVWGLYGSYVMASANFGTLLGGVVGTVLRHSLTFDQLVQWGWRIPFLSGILVSICGLYLKYFCDEEDAMVHHHGPPPGERQPPLWMAFAKKNLRSLASACMVPMIYSGGIYLAFVWMAIYMLELIPNPMEEAFTINAGAMFLSICILFPYAGILSDKYGRKTIMTIGGVSFGLLAPILFYFIGLGHPWLAFCCQSILGICLSFWGAPMMAWLVESFDPSIRLTSTAIGYNIGQSSIGGMVPALSTYLVDAKGPNAPGWLLTALAVVSLVALWIIAPQQAVGMEQVHLHADTFEENDNDEETSKETYNSSEYDSLVTS